MIIYKSERVFSIFRLSQKNTFGFSGMLHKEIVQRTTWYFLFIPVLVIDKVIEYGKPGL